MNINKVSADELAALRTLITSFMCDRSTNIKTYADLVGIFENCHRKFNSKNDSSKDLRILDFQKEMQSGKWRGDILITVDPGSELVTDGIHRGIAYLRCIDMGLAETDLPGILIQYRPAFGM